jgi:hypothetical protein
MPKNFQSPYALAMIIADQIYVDPATGKRSILGCFSAIQAHSFPAAYPLICVAVQLTDGRGKVPLRFRLVDADEETTIFESEPMELDFADPRAIMDVGFIIQNATFATPGEYRLQLRADEEIVMERRLILIQQPTSE